MCDFRVAFSLVNGGVSRAVDYAVQILGGHARSDSVGIGQIHLGPRRTKDVEIQILGQLRHRPAKLSGGARNQPTTHQAGTPAF